MKKHLFFALAVVFSFQLAAQTNCRNDTTSIPFIENWSSGSFETNYWETTSGNWVVNLNIGNEAPSANFQNSPLLTDYAEVITSVNLVGDTIIEGDIWFEFDMKLEDISASETEKLLVKLYDGSEWTNLYMQKNKGSFDWKHFKLNISSLAKNHIFQIQFEALGQNTNNIQNWFVDNIKVSKICMPPKKLDGDAYWIQDDSHGALLKWISPDMPASVPDLWIHWDNGTNLSGQGLTGDGAFTVAAYWPENTITNYGYSITQVKVFAFDNGFTSWTLKIWSGADAANLLYSEDITDQINIGSWTTITLQEPLAYDIADELWVGYTVDGLGGFSPAGRDAGPEVDGYGNKIQLDGGDWENMSDYGFHYNWNIEAFISLGATSQAIALPISNNKIFNQKNANKDRSLSHFNIYSMGIGENEYSFLAEVPFVNGQTNYQYYDRVDSWNTVVCYKVTAVWESTTDTCESEPARAKLSPPDDYVCVFLYFENIEESQLTEKISIFPNPATSQLNIQSEVEIEAISLVNAVGQVVLTKQIQGKDAVLDISNLFAGIYIVRVKTDKSATYKKVVVRK
jgi:hypothetical protein